MARRRTLTKILPIQDAALGITDISEDPLIIDSDGTVVELPEGQFGLCRCGLSQTKPFCDLTHRTEGFSSERLESRQNKQHSYTGTIEGQEVELAYTPMLCGHVAECVRLQAAVFDPEKRPWIQPEYGTLEGLRTAVEACPSGALRISVGGEELHQIETGTPVGIRVLKDGPYVVHGVELQDEYMMEEGAQPATPLFNGIGASEDDYILCRCGHSKNKPFCDGEHREVGWSDDAN